MKGFVLKGIAIATLMTAGLTSCNGEISDELQSTVEAAKYDIQEMVADEVQKTVQKQVEDFIQSNDFGKSVGISEEEKEELQQSFMEYLSEYDLGTEDVESVKESISNITRELAESKDTKITKEEIEQRLSEMLQQE